MKGTAGKSFRTETIDMVIELVAVHGLEEAREFIKSCDWLSAEEMAQELELCDILEDCPEMLKVEVVNLRWAYGKLLERGYSWQAAYKQLCTEDNHTALSWALFLEDKR